MADEAKIVLTTEAKDEGLQKLNKELAAGMQNVAAMKRQLKDMEAATKQGTTATKEQADAMRQLRQEINEQTQANQKYARAINSSIKEMEKTAKAAAAADAGAAGLASKFKITEGFTTAFSVALGNLATTIMTGAVAALASLGEAVFTAGAKMDQGVSKLSGIKDLTDNATEAYRTLNDTYRNTNYDESAVQQMGIQLMTLGYSAKNAADLIQLCADTSAGLGKGQAAAQAMVDTISRMQATGEATSKQFVSLQISGMDLDKAFSKIGMTAEQAYKALDDGSLDAQKAIGALTDYMHEFDGSMAKSKNNAVDLWGDLTGNLQTFCAEIGAGIFEAFNQSEIIQDLIAFTQDLIDAVRGEGCGAFSDLKQVAQAALDIIDGALNIIITTFKLVVLAIDSTYEAFLSFGRDAYEALQPLIDGLLYIYDLMKSILSSAGKGLAGEVNRSWKKTFGGDQDDPGNIAVINTAGNRFRPRPARSAGGGRSGGGGGGSAVKQLTEEEKQIDALIKKYSDADKQKWAMAKSTVELAKVNLAMFAGEAKTAEEKRVKLLELETAHNQLMDGYSKELLLAGQIKDAEKRDEVLDSIMAQIRAEKDLYDAKVQAAEFTSNYGTLQEQSKSIIDKVFGNKDELQQKIENIKKELTAAFQEIDAVMATPDEEEQLSGLAKILKTTPEAFQADLEAKSESITQFVDRYKTELEKKAEAEKSSLTMSEQWAKKTEDYVAQIGKSMGSAMAEFIMGQKSAKDALKDFAKALIQNAAQLLAQWLSVYALFIAFGLYDPHQAALAATKVVLGVGEGGKTIKQQRAGKATGGLITGPGTGTSDSIPTMLSNGEFVIRSAAVDRIGLQTLEAINAGRVPEFANGGSVDDALETDAGGGTSLTLNISALDAASFASFLDRGGLNSIKQALYEDNRRFGSEVGVW